MATVLYTRVSTAEQTIDHQTTQAVDAGFSIDTVVADHAVSGVSTKLEDRTEGKRRRHFSCSLDRSSWA